VSRNPGHGRCLMPNPDIVPVPPALSADGRIYRVTPALHLTTLSLSTCTADVTVSC
jgi:hypothetical protein